jgi:hypothetical protein
MRVAPVFFLLALTACAAPAQVISGTVRDSVGPIAGVSVNIQYFPTTACKALGTMTTEMTAAQQAEFKRCAQRLPSVFTTSTGAFEAKDLKPGWYSLSFRWKVAGKPRASAPFGRYDGYVVMHTAGVTPDEHYVVALANDPVELKPGGRVEKRFVYRR